MITLFQAMKNIINDNLRSNPPACNFVISYMQLPTVSGDDRIFRYMHSSNETAKYIISKNIFYRDIMVHYPHLTIAEADNIWNNKILWSKTQVQTAIDSLETIYDNIK